MDFVTTYNAAEAVWWIGLGVSLPFLPIRPDAPRCRRLLVVTLIVFGASDVIETITGAWWRPWWLATLKVTCGISLAVLVLLWFREARRHRRP